MPMFIYVWEYRVKPYSLDAFIAAYKPGGDWTEFFSRDEGYIATELHADVHDRLRFVTIDRWVSKSARDGFRDKYRAEFDGIDKRCVEFTDSEKFIGDFELVD